MHQKTKIVSDFRSRFIVRETLGSRFLATCRGFTAVPFFIILNRLLPFSKLFHPPPPPPPPPHFVIRSLLFLYPFAFNFLANMPPISSSHAKMYYETLVGKINVSCGAVSTITIARDHRTFCVNIITFPCAIYHIY